MEGRYGFWRGFVDEQVRRYLDCGLFENGFASVWVAPEDGAAVERLARYIKRPPVMRPFRGSALLGFNS